MNGPRIVQVPPFGPQRLQPSMDQQGNPLQSSPNMQHPPWNPSGMLPGSAIPRGPEAWSGQASQDFRSDGTNQVWNWSSPVFDLRPGVSASYGQIAAAVPINHEGALGQSVYLNVLLTDVSGVSPPALTADFRVFYTEDGSTVAGGETYIYRLNRPVEITDQLIAGGITTTPPYGASILSFTPASTAIRFWRVNITFQIGGVAAITYPFQLFAGLH